MDDDLQTASLYAAVAMLVQVVVSLTAEIALIAVALGPVRRARPDASGLFVGAGAILATTTIVGPVLTTVGSVLASRMAGDPAAYVRLQAVLGLVMLVVRTAGFALIIAGIARLAAPKRHDPREPT